MIKTNNNNSKNIFDIKSKELNYNIIINEIFNSDKKEINAMFHSQYNYSITNLCLAMAQCHAQGFKFGLLKCVSQWQKENRTKKTNANKLWLRLPIVYVKKDKNGMPLKDKDGKEEKGLTYKFANNWLTYDMTTGEELNQDELNNIFDFDKCLSTLKIKKVDFDEDGMAGGYAIVKEKELAVNPAWHDSVDVAKVMFHELGHIVLEHKPTDNRHVKELEAELVALLMCKILDIDFNNQIGYIQTWTSNNSKLLTKEVYKRCFKAVEKICKASR